MNDQTSINAGIHVIIVGEPKEGAVEAAKLLLSNMDKSVIIVGNDPNYRELTVNDLHTLANLKSEVLDEFTLHNMIIPDPFPKSGKELRRERRAKERKKNKHK